MCDCQDCKAVNKFLSDENEESHRFPLAKHRREHLHQVIDRNQIDLTHKTEHRGSPHVLVCQKTTGSYKRRQREYRSDLAYFGKLEAILKKID